MYKKHSHFLAHDKSKKHTHGDDSHRNFNLVENATTYKAQADTNNTVSRVTGGKVLFWCFILTFIFSLVEIFGGFLVNSVALQSDGVHMLTDAAGLIIAFVANIISQRPATKSLSFGHGKAEVVGALINCMFTTILTLWLIFEVVGRFSHPVEVKGAGMFIIATLAALVNGSVVFILNKNSAANSLNTKAALLHALGDLLASIIAIVAGGIIYLTGWSVIDPLLSLAVIIILLVSNYNLMSRSILFLMARVPEHIDYDLIGKDLLNESGVRDVHDLHIWQISASKVALSAHLICSKTATEKILENCQEMLWQKHQIDHITLQLEFNIPVNHDTTSHH